MARGVSLSSNLGFDRLSLVHGVRRVLQLMLATKDLEPYIEVEAPSPGLPPF